jgi:hypothetical protein
MATRNIVPRANGEGSIGTAVKHWGNGYFDELNTEKLVADDVIAKGPVVDIRAFGAKGDGVHDDTAAIQAAFASNAYTYYFPRGTYKVTQTITISKSVRIIGDNAILKFTSGYLLLQGSLDDAISVSTNVQEGDNEITLTTNSINAGDYILLIDDTDYSFSNYRAYYKKSDIFRIKENTGTKLVLEEQTTAFYNASHDLKVMRINMITVDIHGINIEATANDSSYALACKYCVNSHISNCSTKFGAYGSLYLDMCLNFNVDETYSYQTGGIDGYKYGIEVSESKNVTVRNSVAHGGRHAIAIGSDGRGICRNIVIDGCDLSKDDLDVTMYCADIHGAASNVTYINNRISGGVCIAGEDANYINNIIVSPGSYYPAVSLVEAVGGSFRVINNKIIMSKGNTSVRAIGFHSTSFLRDITYDYTFEVKDNEIAFNGQQRYCCEFGTHSSANVRPSFEVSNNLLTNNYTTLKYLVVWVGEAASGESPIAPRNITFRDFKQCDLPYTFELLHMSTGALSGCRIEFPVEAYRLPVSVKTDDYYGMAETVLKYTPTLIKAGENWLTPINVCLRLAGEFGQDWPRAIIQLASTGNVITVKVVNAKPADKFVVDRTFYVDAYVGGAINVP